MKIWDKDQILELLRVNDKAVARAILALYARQTADEQSGDRTSHSNGVGFNQIDARFMSSVAKALPKWNNHMTERQLKTARKMLPKYHRQLVEIANENAARATVDPVDDGSVQNTQSNPNFGRY